MQGDETIWFIGDLHGEWKSYKWMISKMSTEKGGKGLDCSFQVGDFGVFDQQDYDNIPDLGVDHKWIRGNHDNPELINQHPSCLGDFGYIPDLEMFFAAGGFSVDRAWRTAHIDWWPNEELTASQWWRVHEMYGDLKPKIVVSHECPNVAKMPALAACGINANNAKILTSSTEMMLQQMLEVHEPDLWIFGHYHYKLDEVIGNTRFVCCGAVNIAPLKDTFFEIPGLSWPKDLKIVN